MLIVVAMNAQRQSRFCEDDVSGAHDASIIDKMMLPLAQSRATACAQVQLRAAVHSICGEKLRTRHERHGVGRTKAGSISSSHTWSFGLVSHMPVVTLDFC